MPDGKKVKEFFGIISVLAIYILIMTVTGIGCPIKWLTGISCPGCGLTRSCLALLRLDFKSSFEYHALTLLILPSLIYIIFGKKPLFGKKKHEMAFYIIFFSIIMLYYTIRFIILENNVVNIDIEQSLVIKLVKIFKEWFS